MCEQMRPRHRSYRTSAWVAGLCICMSLGVCALALCGAWPYQLPFAGSREQLMRWRAQTCEGSLATIPRRVSFHIIPGNRRIGVVKFSFFLSVLRFNNQTLTYFMGLFFRTKRTLLFSSEVLSEPQRNVRVLTAFSSFLPMTTITFRREKCANSKFCFCFSPS